MVGGWNLLGVCWRDGVVDRGGVWCWRFGVVEGGWLVRLAGCLGEGLEEEGGGERVDGAVRAVAVAWWEGFGGLGFGGGGWGGGGLVLWVEDKGLVGVVSLWTCWGVRCCSVLGLCCGPKEVRDKGGLLCPLDHDEEEA